MRTSEKLRVLMVSTSYPETPEDWKGRFIADLVDALDRRDDLTLSLWAPSGYLPERTSTAASPSDKKWLYWMSHHGGIAHLLRTRGVLAAPAALSLLTRLWFLYRRQPADIVHVNWLQNALPLWGTKTPAIISVLGTDLALLRLPGMKPLLRAVLKQRRTILAPNAAWMASPLKEAFGDIAKILPIPFGVDDRWFQIQRQPFENSERHWLCITRLTKNKIGNLFDWGAGLFNGNRRLHLFGPMQEHIDIPPWVTYHGPTHPAELLRDWFPTASGLISLSCHDEGRPQVMLEAMAAGLPVIASDLPAHRDLITHGQNGWIVTAQDSVEKALTRLEDATENQSLGVSAQHWIKECMGNWDDCAECYHKAYRDLLERK